MNYFEKFTAQKEKLDNLMEEHHLLAKFNTDRYPMSLHVMQNQTPEAQMALYDTQGDGVSSKDSKLVLTFPVGEIGVRIYGRLIMSDALMNKIKNCGKKMRDLYQQAEFASRMERMERVWREETPADEEEGEAPADFQEFLEEDSEPEDENEGAEE